MASSGKDSFTPYDELLTAPLMDPWTHGPMDPVSRLATRPTTTCLSSMASVAPVDARVLGRAYEKQLDVVIARWDRGPELAHQH